MSQASTSSDNSPVAIARIIAYVSIFTMLSAGQMIATGTPGGAGAEHEATLATHAVSSSTSSKSF